MIICSGEHLVCGLSYHGDTPQQEVKKKKKLCDPENSGLTLKSPSLSPNSCFVAHDPHWSRQRLKTVPVMKSTSRQLLKCSSARREKTRWRGKNKGRAKIDTEHKSRQKWKKLVVTGRPLHLCRNLFFSESERYGKSCCMQSCNLLTSKGSLSHICIPGGSDMLWKASVRWNLEHECFKTDFTRES